MLSWKQELLAQLYAEEREAMQAFDYSDLCRIRQEIADIKNYDPEEYDDSFWDEEITGEVLLEGLVEPL